MSVQEIGDYLAGDSLDGETWATLYVLARIRLTAIDIRHKARDMKRKARGSE